MKLSNYVQGVFAYADNSAGSPLQKGKLIAAHIYSKSSGQVDLAVWRKAAGGPSPLKLIHKIPVTLRQGR